MQGHQAGAMLVAGVWLYAVKYGEESLADAELAGHFNKFPL